MPKANSEYRNFTTTDSDHYPNSGIYVATANYEVCVVNGGVIERSATSDYVRYDASTTKIEVIKKGVNDILGT